MLSVLSLGFCTVHMHSFTDRTLLLWRIIVEDQAELVLPIAMNLRSVVLRVPSRALSLLCASYVICCMGDKSTTGSSGGAIHFIMVRVSKQVMLEMKDAALDNVEGGYVSTYIHDSRTRVVDG